MSTWRVVFADNVYPRLTAMETETASAGALLEAHYCQTEDEVIRACADADAILCARAPMTRRVLESLPRCRVVVRMGVGYDVVDLRAATELGIMVANVPDYCVDEVADHAIALLLACRRKLLLLDRRLRSGAWDLTPVQPIMGFRGSRLGLLGFGRIARAVAARARAFGMEVVAHDPYLPASAFEDAAVARESLEGVLRACDHLSLHLPLSEKTHHLIADEQIRTMKPSAVVINTSRGALVDETALVAALREGRLAGAGLDVFESEPAAPSSGLLSLENVVLTPHVAYYSERSLDLLQTLAARAAIDVLRGGVPSSLVNAELLRDSRAGRETIRPSIQ